MKYILLIVILGAVLLFLQNRNANKEPKQDTKTCSYEKKCLMTSTEKKFYAAIRNSVGSFYTVQPQINLASIVEKKGDFRFQNELFRNIDFGIFDMSYNILLLIEINDETHNAPNRRKRDAKVKEICTSAGIPLITFHTKYGVNQEYIDKKIREHINVTTSIQES